MSTDISTISYAPKDFTQLDVFCQRICKTGMVPATYRGKPEDAAVAIMFGNELGLPPMTSLQFIAVINGKPGVHSDAMPGLAFKKKLIIDMQESFEGTKGSDDYTAVCTVTRASGSTVTQRFSVDDAKIAKLWGKVGPWQNFPYRMMQWRARSWAIRDAAPDLFFGMSADELQDVADDQPARGPDKARDITPAPMTIVQPEPASDAAPAKPKGLALYDHAHVELSRHTSGGAWLLAYEVLHRDLPHNPDPVGFVSANVATLSMCRDKAPAGAVRDAAEQMLAEADAVLKGAEQADAA